MKQRPRVRSLDGVEAMPCGPAGLGMNPAQPSKTFSALARLASPVLTRLDLASCRHLTSLSDLSWFGRSTRTLRQRGWQPREPSPDRRAHQPLERLYLYGSTAIEDGDLTPLLGMACMRDLRLMGRRHYRPTVAAVRERLGLAD